MEVLKRYGSLRGFVRDNYSEATQEQVDKAIAFAAEKMSGYLRYDGVPMLDHDVAVAEIVAREIGLGRNSTIAAILHDVIRIANKEFPESVDELSRQIREAFGQEVFSHRM